MNTPSPTKTALVTGGNRGIGLAIAQGLLEAGFEVIIGACSLEQGKIAAEALQTPTTKVSVIELDVADDESISHAAQQLNQQISHLNILVNNAGILPDSGINLLNINRDLLIRTLNTNTFGAIQVTQAFLPLLSKAKSARIINISSSWGQLTGLYGNAPAYSLSKLALNGATIMLADALRGKNIPVNAVDPGWVSTDMGGASAPQTPESGADTAIWLATEASPGLSGKLFYNRHEVSY